MKPNRLRIACRCLIALGVVVVQPGLDAQGPVFDVVSIKRNPTLDVNTATQQVSTGRNRVTARSATTRDLLTLALGFLGQNPVTERREFPLEPGMYWSYEGNVAWAEPGAPAVQRRRITWRMEIVEVITRDWTTAAVLKGHPRDLVFFDSKREPRTSLLVSVNLQKYYLLEGDRVQPALNRLKDPKDLLMGLVRESELFLETPISIGKRFCDTEMLTRTDDQYCWWVDEEREPTIKSIPGMQPGWDGPEYTMSYRSPSSSEFIGFAPGIGITSYDFSHHGTSSEVQLKLTAFGRTASR